MSAIKIISQNFFRELSTGSVPFLLGNAGDKLRVETTFAVQNLAISSSDNAFIVNDIDGYIGRGWIRDPRGQFKSFNVGDKIYYSNYDVNTPVDTGTFYVIAKLSDNEIQINSLANGSGVPPSFGSNFEHSTGAISNQTAITAVKYHFNFIENSASNNFTSYIDGNEQLFSIKSKLGSDTSASAMLPIGQTSWLQTVGVTKDFAGSAVDTCSISGISASVDATGVYTTLYKIIHYVRIPDYITYDQVANEIAGIYPKDFQTVNKCWKFISQIEAAELYTDPNFLVSDIFSKVLGNTGWRGENFNTGKSNYSISSVIYSNGGTVPSAILDESGTTLTFNLNNTVEAPFNSNTMFVVTFQKVPHDPAEYINTGLSLDKNFCTDRAVQKASGGPVNGENYGTSYQAIKGLVATYLSSTQIGISLTLELGADTLALLRASSSPQYEISISTQAYGVAINNNALDAVNLKVDLNTATIITADATMINFETTKFIRHPEFDPSLHGVTSLFAFPQDEVVACTNFYIESSGRTGNVIKLQTVNARIMAKNGSKTFELDQFLMSLSSIPMTGYTQQFDSQIPRVFNVPATSIRKFIEVKRRNDLDTETKYYFSSNYPFLLRWETWTQALGIDPSFFDATLQNNGFNEWWYRYGIASGWSLYYDFTVTATKDGDLQSYNTQVAFSLSDYKSNADYTVKDILPFESSDLALLLSGAGGAHQLNSGGSIYVTINGQKYYTDGNNFNYMNKKTLIAAIFTRGTAFVEANVNVEMSVEVYQQGGIAGERVYSSKWVTDGNSWFTSVDGSGKVKLYTYDRGFTFVALAYFDPTTTNFPANATAFSFSARIYDIASVGALETDDSVPITTDGGVQITID